MTAKPIIACLALLVLAACSQSEPPVALQDPNPGFERMKGETVFGWASEGPSGRAWTPVADPVYSGRHALALAPSSTPGAVRLVSAPFAVTRGDWVKLEAWVRPPDKDHFQGRAYIEIKRKNRWHVLGVPATGSAARDWQPNDRSWIPWICHAFVPEGIQQARSVFEAQCGADVLEPWVIDDFSFRIGSLETYLDNAQSTERLDDVMLVGVDTLAQRFLSCYGADVHTPVIQRLAEEGKTFLHVMPAAPWTRPSFTSIFTSLYPSQHANDVLNAMIPDDVTTMAQLLKQRGYFTVAFARTSYDGQLGPGVHFDKGFDIYCHTDDEDYLFDMARSFLKENNANLKRLHAGGIFIFYHFQEPHSPYVNRNPKNVNRGLLGTVPITPEIILDTLRHPDPSTSNEYDGQYARACYASEIEFVDSRLGALFDDLDAAGLYDGLNIVFTADHGESFGEKDGVWLHGNPYNTTTLVPLILRFPGQIDAGSVDGDSLVSSLDVLPTMATLVGLPAMDAWEGRSLLGPQAPGADRYTVCEDVYYGSICLRDRRFKLVVNNASVRKDPEDHSHPEWTLFNEESSAKYEVYDLENDPLEQHELSAEQPDIAKRLKKALEDHCRKTGIYPGSHTARQRKLIPLTPQTRDDLEALGYF